MDAGDWAAWAQFGAAVIGLGIAIFVPWKIHANERSQAEEERQVLQQCITHTVWLPLSRLDAELRDVLDVLDRGLKDGGEELKDERFFVRNRAAWRIHTTSLIATPIVELQYLGAQTAARVLRINSVLAPIAETAKEIDSAYPKVQHEGRVKLLRTYQEQIATTLSACEALKADLTPIYRKADDRKK